MEVHAHSHTVGIAIGGKKFTHYVWEFLMLFLAVFCGFLAENQREHYVEQQREKQYARELYDEFFADSIVVANKISARLEKEKDMDYLSSYVRDSSLTTLPREFYPSYTAVIYLLNSYFFERKDGIFNYFKCLCYFMIFK